MPDPITGACLCGAVRFEVPGSFRPPIPDDGMPRFDERAPAA